MPWPENADALPNHDVRLTDGDLVLRPMREDDLPQALEWDNNPDVRHFMQAETVPLFTLEDLADLYHGVPGPPTSSSSSWLAAASARAGYRT